ncbi:MAG: DsbA family protein [Hyphomicrobiales bacterium]|nr:DsbA family protein [Hyphomicrobiales bacterium]
MTRRDFALGASALALIVALGGPFGSAQAQALLNQPGPLGEITLGDEKAPVTIIEYASMTCPHCATFHVTTFPELKKRYIDTGKVRYIFREFPLDQLALAAFLLARCAGPDRYFAMIDTLFQRQQEWVVQKPLQPLMAIARQAGMGEQAFNECLQNKKLIDGIEEVRQRAIKLNVQSTPTFFINGKPLRGNYSIEEFEKALAPHLKS